MRQIFNIFKRKRKDGNFPIPWGQTNFDAYNVDYDLFVKKAYENPFIQAPFNEFTTNLKALKFEVRKDGEKVDTITSRYVMKTLKRPNAELSFTDMLESIATYLIFGGRFMFYRSPGVTKDNLYLYSPNAFQIIRDERTLRNKEIFLGDTQITEKELEFYHVVKNIDPNAQVAGFGDGYSKIKPLAMIGDMLNYLMEHNNSLLKNGGSVQGIFQANEDAEKEDLIEMKNEMSKVTGSNNAGKIWFTRGESKFHPIATNPKDLDWIEGMKELQKIICRVLGIPEALIMSENSTYNNLEGFKKKVYQDTVIPFANKICEELTHVFRDELGESEEITVVTSNIKALQIGIAKEIDDYSKALDGKITTNDFIKFINNTFELALPLLKGEEGNRVLVSTNMMFLDELGVGYEPTK